MKIAIIPARGGSKRIPRKNIKLFHGKPIIAYSIEVAIDSGMFDKVIVSTDDQEIADIAETYGAEIPFLRSSDISGDYASTNDVITHAIKWYQKENVDLEAVCCIYATSPFLRKIDLLSASEFLNNDTDFVFSAAEFSYPIFRSFSLDKNNRVKMFWPENFDKRSQDLAKAYHDAGMFYFGKPAAFLEGKPFFAEYAKAYILPHYRVQDIDTMDDWYQAEKYYQLLEGKL
jgi:pseudaminic acid cytidylyltransferase